MNIFTITEVRQAINDDIRAISNLITQKLQDLDTLRTALRNAQAISITQFSTDNRAYQACQTATAAARTQLNNLGSAPVVPAAPTSIIIEGNTINSHETLNAWLDSAFAPGPIDFFLGGHANLAKAVQKEAKRTELTPRVIAYLAEESRHNSAVTALNQYRTTRDAALRSLSTAQTAEAAARSNMHTHSTNAAENMSNRRREIQRLVSTILALTQAEFTLRDCLIEGNHPFQTAAEIYNQIHQSLFSQLTGNSAPSSTSSAPSSTDALLRRLRNNQHVMETIQERLNNSLWARRYAAELTSNPTTFTLLFILTAAIYYYSNPTNFDLSKLIGLILIALIVRKISDAEYQLSGLNRSVAQFITRAETFQTNLQNIAQESSDAFIDFMRAMRNNTDQAINTVDHHLATMRYRLGFFGDDLTAEVRGLPGVVAAFGNTVAHAPLLQSHCMLL